MTWPTSLKNSLSSPLQTFADLGETQITHGIILCVGKNVVKMHFRRLWLETGLVNFLKLYTYSKYT